MAYLVPAIAHASSPAETAVEDAQSQASENAQVYDPAYFERYTPRSALDMLEQVPGFTISGGDDEERGLGEASENVVVNGRRLSSKSDSASNQLGRIPAGDVIRIEILDGTSLDIPGLTGQVANVIVTQTGGTAGQFRWTTGFRPAGTASPLLYGGEISVTGSSGALDYTVSLSNPNDRFGARGPILLTAADGSLIESQRARLRGEFDNPRLSTNLTYRMGPNTRANLNLKYGIDYFSRLDPEIGTSANGVIRTRTARIYEDGPEYEIGGDIEFPLGPGQLKLIALDSFERDNFESQVVDRFDNGSAAQGNRFEQVNEMGERIGRFEYGWTMWNADWQVSGEAAFNRLDRVSRLFALNAAEQFAAVNFPSGTGGVREDRYESILSLTRPLTANLTLQVTGGAEYSQIAQTGVAANSRSFLRPKGSLSLSWKPRRDFDVALELRRKVGQLDFGDFLGSVSLNDDNANGGNNELEPDQSWNIELEVNKSLGPWGSAKLELDQAWFQDFIDFFPLSNGGEARGNIGSARRTHLEATVTLKLDPVGWSGAQFDISAVKRWMSVTDPFTGQSRPFSYDQVDELNVNFRHDIPKSSFAYGGNLYTDERAPYSRRFEFGREWEGPTFLSVFVEHKDVLGMTARAQAANLLGARNRFFRTVFDGPRPDAAVLFVEDTNRRIGPIFRFTLSGNF